MRVNNHSQDSTFILNIIQLGNSLTKNSQLHLNYDPTTKVLKTQRKISGIFHWIWRKIFGINQQELNNYKCLVSAYTALNTAAYDLLNTRLNSFKNVKKEFDEFVSSLQVIDAKLMRIRAYRFSQDDGVTKSRQQLLNIINQSVIGHGVAEALAK